MLRNLYSVLTGLPAALADRMRPRPVASVEDAAWFVRTRAAYVAQTSLYGYLKTRMGTKFRDYFEDELFSAEIRAAASRLFVSCAGDLAIFAAATAARDGRLTPDQAAALATRCFKVALRDALDHADRPSVPADAAEAFAARAARTNWAAAAKGETAFAESVDELIRVAPIVDELKQLDREIVRNSIRFRWRDVREQLRRRMREDALREDLRPTATSAGQDD